MSRRARIIIAMAIAVVVIGLLSLRSIAVFYTDYLWFDSLDLSEVWKGVLIAKVGLAVVFMAAMFILTWVNLLIADRLAPTYRPPGPEEEFVRRYHEAIGGRANLVRIAIALLFALFLGAGAGARWQDWILFRNAQDFGVEDPQFGVDVGFYIFRLPFISFAITWMFTALVVVLIITATAHYLNGGIRLNTTGQRVTPVVKGHLSVLLAMLALVKAGDYWYQRYALNFSSRGIVNGASYTDVNAQLPAIYLLMLISLAAAVLLIVNIRRRGWVLPAVAVGLWAFVAVVIGNIYPAIYQRLVVEPSELSRETEFIDRNIIATREAYGLNVSGDPDSPSDIVEIDFRPDVSAPLTSEILLANQETIENARLLDPAIVSPTFGRREADRDQFRFSSDLDVDRYVVDGEQRVVIVAARELNLSGVRTGWENQHVSFTHGYGLAIAAANSVDSQGEPEFLVGGLPTTVDDRIDIGLDGSVLQPRIYVGEGLGGYAIVGTERCEVDFPLTSDQPPIDENATVDVVETAECGSTSGSNQEFAYDGDEGVRAGGLFRRAAFALRFQDLNPIFSNLIKDDSRFIYERDVRGRARDLAPFLDFDADSYPAVIDGRIVFILDAYTTSSNYPYAQTARAAFLPTRSDLRHPLNYVRNSVKVTVDAYNGDVNFFIVDETDPLIKAYEQAFPGLFKTRDHPLFTEELASHFRYPEDLFRVQTSMWATYQLSRPEDFFDDTAAWSVADDPGRDLESRDIASGTPIDPYYVQMALPGEDEQSFMIYRPFVPSSRSGANLRQELTGFMAGRTNEHGERELVSYRLPGTNIDGPVLANAVMLNNTVVASQATLLGQQGSTVLLGNMLMLPLQVADDSDRLLYVRPLYVDASGGLPLARRVIVAYGTDVRICPTLERALGALFVQQGQINEDCDGVISPFTGEVVDDQPSRDSPDPGSDPAPTPTPGPTATPGPTSTPGPTPTPSPPSDDDAVQLLQDAADAFAEADGALAAGNLGRYQELVDQAEDLIRRALELLGPPIPTPAPTAVPTPTSSPT